MSLKETGYEDVDWVYLLQYTYQWRIAVIKVNLHEMHRISSLPKKPLDFEEGLCYRQLAC
jgi:hypothetical protein